MRFGPRIRWDVTLVCNLACKHCQVGDIWRGSARHPPKDLVMSVCRNLIDGGVSHIGLLGGEPLLYPSIVELLRLFVQHGLHITISTNGLQLPAELMSILTESSGCSIMVSLDGPDDVTHDFIRGAGTFDRAIGNIEYLVSEADRCHIVVGIACTLTSITVGRMKAFYDLACRLGVNIIQFGIVKAVGNGKTNFSLLHVTPESLFAGLREFLSQVPCPPQSQCPGVLFDFVDRPTTDILRHCSSMWTLPPSTDCVAADSTAFVDSSGCMWPCPAVYEGFRAGTLSYKGRIDNSLVVHEFDAVWYGTLFQKFRQLKQSKPHLNSGQPCKLCTHAPTCMPCPLPVWYGTHYKNDLCAYSLGL